MTKRWGLPDYPGKGGGRGHSTNWFYGGAERCCESALVRTVQKVRARTDWNVSFQ